MTTTKELLQTLNALRTANGKTELAGWKSSREKLEAAISELTPAEETKSWIVDDELVDPIDEQPAASDLSDVEGQMETTPEQPAIPRGAIGAMSIELLSGTDLPYDEIVARIKAVYPAAKTTARSLASVAMDLRGDGVDVPSRRKPAKAKPAKTTEAAGE